MTDSIDALITEGRKLTSAYGRYSAYGELVRNLADALESTAAELRQERERTALHDAEDVEFDKDLTRIKADLARAREVIEKVRAAFVAQTHKQMVRDINLAIVEYDTKEKS